MGVITYPCWDGMLRLKSTHVNKSGSSKHDFLRHNSSNIVMCCVRFNVPVMFLSAYSPDSGEVLSWNTRIAHATIGPRICKCNEMYITWYSVHNREMMNQGKWLQCVIGAVAFILLCPITNILNYLHVCWLRWTHVNKNKQTSELDWPQWSYLLIHILQLLIWACQYTKDPLYGGSTIDILNLNCHCS